MGGFVDTATDVISRAMHRVDIAAQNLSNVATAGYKRRVDFGQALADARTAIDFSPGKVSITGAPTDLAILGQGFFAVASQSGAFYTRGGQFQRDGDGRLVTPDGFALQDADGGDLILKGAGPFKVMADGTVTEGGEPTGQIAVVALGDSQNAQYVEGGLLSAPAGSVTRLDAPSIRQGAIESSNVSNAAEMIAIMRSVREAEAGQKLVNVYDDIMGRLLESLGQAGAG